MSSELILNSAATDWISSAIGASAKLTSSKRLICGPASPVFLLEADVAGESRRYVLRLYVDEERLGREPDPIVREAAALRLLSSADLPTPHLLDYSADTSVFGYPALLMSCLDGTVNIKPANLDHWLDQLAETLATIHSIAVYGVRWHYQSYTEVETLCVPPWSKRSELWEKAINIRLEESPPYDEVFLHRDYHPVNILWVSGKLTGIVDWVGACLGPANVDVAHCQINLATMFGPEIAGSFREKYHKVAAPHYLYHSFWEIDSILDWAIPKPGFYPPWTEYGIKDPGQEVLFCRFDDYLDSIIAKI